MEANHDIQIRLRDNLITYFSQEELEGLAFDLGINLSDLSGGTKNQKAEELIKYCGRREMLSKLVERASYYRPKATWPANDLTQTDGPTSNQRQFAIELEHELTALMSVRTALESQAATFTRTPDEIVSEITFIDDQIQLIKDKRNQETVPNSSISGTNRGGIANVSYRPRPRFIGRTEELNTLLALLSPSNSGKVYLVKGITGIGKSTLALEAGYRAMELGMTDDIITVDMPSVFDSTDRLVDPTHTITESIVLQARSSQNKDGSHISHTTRVETVRQVLTSLEKRFTIIIDNLQDDLITRTQTLEFLRDAVPAHCKVIVTSTFHSAGVDYVLPLKGMHYPEAAFFMRREARMKDATALFSADYRQLKAAWSWTSGIPLAMRWLVGYVSEAAQSLRRVLEDLKSGRGNEDSLLKELFEQSFRLIKQDESKLNVLLALSTFATHANWDSLLSVSNVKEDLLTGALGSLYRLSLVEFNSVNDYEQYRLLPITRRFVNRSDNNDLSYFYIRAVEYYSNTFRGKDELALQSPEVWRRFNRERQNIMSILDWCIDNDRWESFIEIGIKINAALGYSGEYPARLRYAMQLLKAAEQFKKPALQAWILVHELGWITQHTGDYETAESSTRQAIKIASDIGDKHTLALATRNLGILFYRKAKRQKDPATKSHQFEEALSLTNKARELFEALDDPRWKAITLRGEAMIKQELGELEEARNILETALFLHRQVADYESEALTISDLGGLALISMDYDRARELLNQALELDDRENRPFGRARNRQRLAHIEHHFGERDKATALLNEAFSIFQDMNAWKAIEVLEIDAEKMGIQLVKYPKEEDSFQPNPPLFS